MRIMLSIVVIACGATLALAQGPSAKPGPEHEILKKGLGTRNAMMKIMPQGPIKEAIEFPVKETNTMIHNGFWMESKLDAGPYQGSGVFGYDPIKKKYVGNWISNVTPHMSVMAGTYNAKTHELTMVFTDLDPVTQKPTQMKSVGRTAPGEQETFTMYRKDAESGKWLTTFVITYEAAKKAEKKK